MHAQPRNSSRRSGWILGVITAVGFAFQPISICAANDPGSTNVVWSVGGQIDYSTAALGSNGVVYIGSKDNRLWAFNPDGSTNGSWLTQGIVQGSPALGADGTIYCGSGDGRFYAFNPDGTTQHVWQTGLEVYSSPAIGLDGTIYVGSYNSNFYAFNPDGTTQHVWTTTGGIDSSPAIGGDGTIYVGAHTIDDSSGANALYAFNPDGTTQHVWQVASNVMYSSPAIGSDGVIYQACMDQGGVDGKLYAFNQDGTTGQVWDAGGGFVSSPCLGTNGTIYIGRGDGAVLALNPNGTTQQVWSVPIGGFALLASPTIGADGTVYIGANDNRFYALNPNGTTAFVYNVGGWIYSGSALDSNGTVYVGCRDSQVYAFAGTGAGLADSPWPKFRGDARNTGRSPLLAPQNVGASRSSTSPRTTVRWTARANALSYEVWRAGESNLALATAVGQTNGTNFVDDTGSASGDRWYWVKARYAIGNSGLGGGVLCAVTNPPPPAVLTVSPTSRSVGPVAGTTAFAVTNTGGGTMAYTASESLAWLSIAGGGTGINRGTITISYLANPGATARTGTVMVTAPGAIGSPRQVQIVQDGRIDVYEPDDSRSMAKPIANGQTQRRTIHVAGNSDWARFRVDGNGAQNLRLETAGASGDSQLWLYKRNGELVAYNDNGGVGDFSRVVVASLAPGSYYIRVREYGNNGTIPAYTLKASWVAASRPVDTFEPDDFASAAKTIANGLTQRHSIHAAGNEDWVKFKVGRRGALNFRLETSGASGNTQIWLYGARGRKIAYDDNSGAGNFSRITLPALARGTYTVKIREKGNNSTIRAYHLQAIWTAP